jgi:hypothetical protein
VPEFLPPPAVVQEEPAVEAFSPGEDIFDDLKNGTKQLHVNHHYDPSNEELI